MSARPIMVADLFCGAGGSSTGAAHAIAGIGRTMQLVAVNHWPVAIETHTANHPDAAHYCVDLDAARPEELIPGGELDLLLASPECTHHSRAYGGRPINDQRRSSAWHIPRWAERLYIRRLIVENVPEFLEWGPLDRRGRPLRSKRGQTFKAWVAALESLGYRVEWRILNAADYGDATTRQRLFVMARRDGRRIVWPVASHDRDGSSLFGERERWRAAREVIDWSLPGTSIFERARPLSPNTLRRIEAGIRRYCRGAVAEAFVVVLRRHADARSLGDPLPTVTAGGTHLGLAEPSLQPFLCANRTSNAPKSVDQPIPVATTTTGGGIFMAEPTAFVLGQHGGAAARNVEEPLPTIVSDGAISVVKPFMVEVAHGGDRRPRTLDEPVATVTTKRNQAVIEPFVTAFYGDKEGVSRVPRSVEEPLATIPTANRFGVVEPFLVAHFGERPGQAPRTHDVDVPLPTVTQRGAGDLVEAVLTPEDGPADRVVMIDGVPHVLDIRFRMLQPHELAAAMGFPSEYVFTGTKEAVTKMIGNAVPVNLSRALVDAALSDMKRSAEDAA